jgi:hypothetical protein
MQVVYAARVTITVRTVVVLFRKLSLMQVVYATRVTITVRTVVVLFIKLSLMQVVYATRVTITVRTVVVLFMVSHKTVIENVCKKHLSVFFQPTRQILASLGDIKTLLTISPAPFSFFDAVAV